MKAPAVVFTLAVQGLFGQSLPLPPAPSYPTRYFAVTATDGTNNSDPSNEVSTNLWPVELDWQPSTTPNVWYLVWSGRASGTYSPVAATTNLSITLPPPPPPVKVVGADGGQVFFCATNPPGQMFFREQETSDPSTVVIDSSPDLLNWSTYTILDDVTNGELTMTTTPL